jgi:hypothetical protein
VNVHAKPEQKFFIVTRDRDDCALFWRPNRSGYTQQLEEAGRYSKKEADEICSMRGEEFAVPCELIEQASVRLVKFDAVIKFAPAEVRRG